MPIKSLTKFDIFNRAITGRKFTKDEILAMYADPKNWEKVYDATGCRWVWKGPVTCAYEAAQWALEEKV